MNHDRSQYLGDGGDERDDDGGGDGGVQAYGEGFVQPEYAHVDVVQEAGVDVAVVVTCDKISRARPDRVARAPVHDRVQVDLSSDPFLSDSPSSSSHPHPRHSQVFHPSSHLPSTHPTPIVSHPCDALQSTHHSVFLPALLQGHSGAQARAKSTASYPKIHPAGIRDQLDQPLVQNQNTYDVTGNARVAGVHFLIQMVQ
jgi:hypothetical protein